MCYTPDRDSRKRVVPMYRTFDYVHDFGELPYTALPFNDCDNFAICSALYMEIEKVVTDELEQEPTKTFGEACRDLYAYFDYKIVPPGLFLNKVLFKNFLDLGSHSRYADMKITGCRSHYDAQQVVQFAAQTLFIDDDTILVVYRGTDDSIVGWHEDLDMLVKKVIPSHALALTYIKDVAEAYPDKKIMIAGHSKGGHIALYTALSCPAEIRKRLVRVYNNDGPGFAERSLLDSPAYQEIRPIYRHYVPSSSLIGVMMQHDNDYKVVKSSGFLGLSQHGAETWKCKNDEPDTRESLNFVGKLHELALADLLEILKPEDLQFFYEALCNLIYAPGQRGLLGVAQNAGLSLKLMAEALFTRTPAQKKVGRGIGRTFAGILVKDANKLMAKQVADARASMARA